MIHLEGTIKPTTTGLLSRDREQSPTGSSQHLQAIAEGDAKDFRVSANFHPQTSYTAQENRIPAFHDLFACNSTLEPSGPLTVELKSTPAFIEPYKWELPSLPGTHLEILDTSKLRINKQLLYDLPEQTQGRIEIELRTASGKLLDQQTHLLQIHPRNYWNGLQQSARLLPAFSDPNAPGIGNILEQTSKILAKNNLPPEIDGYATKSRKRVWEFTAAVYFAIKTYGFTHNENDEASLDYSQQIQDTKSLSKTQTATSLELALLFTAVLEKAGLNPLVIFHKNHVAVGVWLQQEEFPEIETYDATRLRKRIETRDLLVFDPTAITLKPAPIFKDAADQWTAILEKSGFLAAIDIRRARTEQIKPAVFFPNANPEPATPGNPVNASDVETTDLTNLTDLDSAPNLPLAMRPINEDAETNTGSAAEKRFEAWKNKLLDLTTRNHLLHIPENAREATILGIKAEHLAAKLFKETSFQLKALESMKPESRDAALFQQESQAELKQKYLEEAFHKKQLHFSGSKQSCDALIAKLHRRARGSLYETGSNTLFLGLGMLAWKKGDKTLKRTGPDKTDSGTPQAGKTYLAPIIMVPVKLERKNIMSPFRLSINDDDPRVNLTLLELLRQDYEIQIPEINAQGIIPLNEKNNPDIARILHLFRETLKDLPEFEVIDESTLGHFSFQKYLMWQDLATHKTDIRQNPILRLLMQPHEEREPGIGIPDERTLDSQIHPSELFMPLPADSSQTAAVVASANGTSFVLNGPPGTGKSQTISNMIAHNLALGKRVLFVSEKTAALEVVHRRLSARGLGMFCLEIHSNKATKLHALEQLKAAWQSKNGLSEELWQKKADEIQKVRETLNQIARLPHQRQANGLTLFRALGAVIRNDHPGVPALQFPGDHTAEEYQALLETCRKLELHLQQKDVVEQFAHLEHLQQPWSIQWQEQLLQQAVSIRQEIDEVLKNLQTIQASLGLSQISGEGRQIDNPEELEKTASFLKTLFACYSRGIKVPEDYNFAEILRQGEKARTILGEIQNIQSRLSTQYQFKTLKDHNLAETRQKWTKANDAWFFKTNACNKVTGAVEKELGCHSTPNIAQDLPILPELITQLRQLDTVQETLAGFPGWKGAETDSAEFGKNLELLDQLRQHAYPPNRLREISNLLNPQLQHQSPELHEKSETAKIHTAWQAKAASLKKGITNFQTTCSGTEGPAQAISFIQIQEQATRTLQQRDGIKQWCQLYKILKQAEDQGLSPLVAAIRNNQIPPHEVTKNFETAYARWFANRTIDRIPELREFNSLEHTELIQRFREADTELANLTQEYIRTRLRARIPDNSSGVHEGYSILTRELQKKARHKPIRQLIHEMGSAFEALAPCMLMSPLSIAQYLPLVPNMFDLVIFDEASQVAPYDALGAIARGKQVIICGDPEQMPPSNFFARSINEPAEGEEEEDTLDEMESILDECLAAGMTSHTLNWHYRSKHESLIAFSNHHFYGDKLTTFPAALTRPSAVSFHHVDGNYSRGAERTNPIEADAIIDEVIRRLTDPEFIAAGKSLGIITLNKEQQELIESKLEEAQIDHPEIREFFEADLPEPVIVKNLETIQGDERDLIILGIGQSPTPEGYMLLNFGPLNREGGYRRLNVAITRARHEMMVFASFEPHQLRTNETTAVGVRHLKAFLQYAKDGPAALNREIKSEGGTYESPFEEAVAIELKKLGWEAVPQIGISKFRIDLGIVNPEQPGDYLVGIECDGATYHSAATARDRDKIRADILKQLGWKLIRIWSTDWFLNKAGCVAALNNELRDHLHDFRNEIAAQKLREEVDKRQKEIAKAEEEAQAAARKEAAAKAQDDPDFIIIETEITPLPEESTEPAPTKKRSRKQTDSSSQGELPL
jgi:REase_MTES_1575/AAA domain/Protein of unknown function (DUF4011)